MGLFFKKSKNFGLFKLNMSKSGIGVSLGVKGLRLSAGPRGVYLNASKDGIYYRKKLNKKSRKEKQQEECAPIETCEPELEEVRVICINSEQNRYNNIMLITIICGVIGVIILFCKPLYGFLIIAGCITTNRILKNKNPEKYEVYKKCNDVWQEATSKGIKVETKIVDDCQTDDAAVKEENDLQAIRRNKSKKNEISNENLKFWQKQWFTWILLILCPVLGIIVLWACNKKFNITTKIILTIVFVFLLFVLCVVKNNSITTDKLTDGEFKVLVQ